MEYRVYEHKTQYYETDQMGIIHHSNYIRWFEEARMDMMEQMGMGYAEMEKRGIISPVLSVHSEYKSMTHFGDTVEILTQLREYNGVGESRHCFLTRDGKPVSLKRNYIEMDQSFRQFLDEEGEA